MLQSYLDVKIVLFIIFYTIKANRRIIQKYCKLVFLLHAPHVSQLSLIWLIYCHTTLVPSPQSPDNIKNIYCRIIINTIYNINTILLLTSTLYYAVVILSFQDSLLHRQVFKCIYIVNALLSFGIIWINLTQFWMRKKAFHLPLTKYNISCRRFWRKM